MKPLSTLVVSMSLISSAAFGAPLPPPVVDACQAIPVGIDRAACYDKQQPKADAGRRATEAAERPKDPLEQMRMEDEALSKRLRGICRGC
jgi:hypothetical protein